MKETRTPLGSRGRSVFAVFALHGMVAGTLAARLPAIADRLHLSPGALGLALLMPACGGLATMPFVGRVIHRIGARSTTRLLIPLWGAALVLPALAGNLPSLIALLTGYGMAAGSADVAMNAAGVEVELRLGRSIMSGLHGLWSVGSFIGSGIGALVAALGIDYRVHLIVAAVVLTALALPVTSALPADGARPAPTEPAPRRFSLPTGRILLLGLVAFCAAFAEGSGTNWSAIYLVRVAGASQAVGAATYATFVGVMAVLRLTGDAVVRRFGPAMVVRVGGLIAAVGGGTVVLARGPALALAGFALLGLGIATIIPLTFAAAGRVGPHPGQAIAGVATVSYTANLIAPAFVGVVANVTSLPVAFIAIAVLAAGITFGARLI